MRETKSRRINTTARNEETESVLEEIRKIRCMWISKKEKDAGYVFVRGREKWVRDWGVCVCERERKVGKGRLGL